MVLLGPSKSALQHFGATGRPRGRRKFRWRHPMCSKHRLRLIRRGGIREIISPSIKERGYWKHYMRAYEDCLSATCTQDAPWYVVPADDKESARLIVSRIVLDAFKALKMTYPKSNAKRRRELLDNAGGAGRNVRARASRRSIADIGHTRISATPYFHEDRFALIAEIAYRFAGQPVCARSRAGRLARSRKISGLPPDWRRPCFLAGECTPANRLDSDGLRRTTS